LKGVIFLIGTIISSVFQEQMTNGINNAIYNFSRFTGVAQADMKSIQDEAFKTAMAMTKDMDGPEVGALREKLQNVYEIQERLRQSIKNMTPEQAEAAKNALKLYEHYADAAIEAAKVAAKAEETAEKTRQAASAKHGSEFQTKIELNNDTAFGSSGGALTSTAANMIN
jgi:hypothetical protein